MSETTPWNRVGWAVLILFLVLYGLDFHQDVGRRDSFSWMDPSQYYSFALHILEGGGLQSGFEVASFFPYLVVPFLALSPTIPSALAVNLAATLLLAFSLLLLARDLRLRVPPALLLLLLFSSPLFVGLSRELYVEYTLASIVALQFVLWFRARGFGHPVWTALFSLLLAAGLLVKMTYPLFLVGPFCWEVVGAVRGKEWGRAARTAAVFLVPIAAVLAGVYFLLPDSFAYYASLGNTRIPIMRLIGPPELLSFGSLSYYPWQLIRTLLGFLAPFFLIPILLFRRVGGGGGGPARARSIHLWLWLIVPLLVLTWQPVKEPRHVAPVVVPAVLLLAAGIGSVRSGRRYRLLAAAAALVAMAQYLGITRGLLYAPYRLTTPLRPAALEEGMAEADPERARFTAPDGSFAFLSWKFSKSIAVSGFGPNESLALAWRFSPGIVCDLDLLAGERGGGESVAYQRFEDLFAFTAFTIYNERCGWSRPYFTLTREEVLGHADYLLCRGVSREEAVRAYPGFEWVVAVEGGGAPGREIGLLRRRMGGDLSYRELYAKQYLLRRAPVTGVEANTIYHSLFLEAQLTGDFEGLRALRPLFPDGYEPGTERRPIYWIAHYAPLLAAVHQPYRRHVTGVW